MLVSYNWLKDYLGDAIPAPEKIVELLTFHAFEIESLEAKDGDTVIDVKILPDRSSDCLSHRGIAREIASLLGVTLEYDPLASVPSLLPTESIEVKIADTNLCPRFTVALMIDITVGESPDWLKDRLAAIGQRSINNIVDATNYVMYAIGQPLHAYDADKFPQVAGKWQFGVRPAMLGETVSLLAESGKNEDRRVTLKGGELLIIDESSGTPIGLAGVKGGRFAGIDSSTTKIIIEAAHFDPIRTRQTARGLGIMIDASKRFENEPSRELPPFAQTEIIKLIINIAGGTFEGYLDVYPNQKTNPAVVVYPVQVNALLGLTLGIDEMAAILHRIGAMVTKNANLTLTCVGPFERTDLQIAEDFIAEIGRIYGYRHIVSVVPAKVPLAEINARHYYSEKIRSVLLRQGFSEVITSSFRKKDKITLLSSLASDKECLRSSLAPNMAEVLDRNAPFTDLLATSDTRVFEIGTVFEKTKTGITEHFALCLGVRLKQSGYSGKEDAVLKTAVALLEQTLKMTALWNIEKGIAELNLTTLLTQLPSPTAYAEVPVATEVTYSPFSLYPAMTRDIAMWVSEGTEVSIIETVLNEAAGPLRVRTTHVDAFTKDGRTSYAFRLVFQASDRTLTDEEINAVMENVYSAAVSQGWETR